jgi:long-subunit fatty acid transport protein
MDSLNLDLKQGNSSKLPQAVSDDFPLDWKDQYVCRLGLENNVTEKLALRCGVTYGNSPVPDKTVIPILCTITEWSATLGLGYKVTQDVLLDIAYMHSFQHAQDADISLVGKEYDNSSTKVALDTVYVSLSARM